MSSSVQKFFARPLWSPYSIFLILMVIAVLIFSVVRGNQYRAEIVGLEEELIDVRRSHSHLLTEISGFTSGLYRLPEETFTSPLGNTITVYPSAISDYTSSAQNFLEVEIVAEPMNVPPDVLVVIEGGDWEPFMDPSELKFWYGHDPIRFSIGPYYPLLSAQ